MGVLEWNGMEWNGMEWMRWGVIIMYCARYLQSIDISGLEFVAHVELGVERGRQPHHLTAHARTHIHAYTHAHT